MARTKDEVLADMAALMTEFLTADTPHDQAMLTGFVFKVAGRAFDNDGKATRLHAWSHSEDQDSFMTLGLATALEQDVVDWYASLTDVDPEDD
jgi:hypothetical protein